ncbi:hypothetical protein HanIR_Chr13g0640951 [Helianthus annuus]|nr:hypothetical protein HanIR_Chr13g0640951 [Helianthus annuus]
MDLPPDERSDGRQDSSYPSLLEPPAPPLPPLQDRCVVGLRRCSFPAVVGEIDFDRFFRWPQRGGRIVVIAVDVVGDGG